MYHAIVRATVRRLWRRVGVGEYTAAVDMAVPDLHFRFIGDTPLGAELTTAAEFGTWFAAVFERFPGVAITLQRVASTGWPWRTSVAVQLAVRATLADGSAYRNTATQWVVLRWGRMVSIEVLEDTVAVDRACRIQAEAGIPA